MSKTVIARGGGKTDVLVFHGELKLNELKELKTGSTFRSSNWQCDSERVYASVNEKETPILAARLKECVAGETLDVVLVRKRKTRRKDGTPVSFSSPWEELDVFEDTITNVAAVAGVWAPGYEELQKILASGVPSAVNTGSSADTSGVDVPTDKTMTSRLLRLAESVSVGVPLPVIYQLGALIIDDGGSPLQVKNIIIGGREANRYERSLTTVAVEPIERAKYVIEKAPAVSVTEMIAPQDTTTAPSNPIVVAGSAPTATPPARTGRSIPPPRRIESRINTIQIERFHSLANVAGVDKKLLNGWSRMVLGRKLIDITEGEADMLLNGFKSMGREEGISNFRTQVEKSITEETA